MNCLFISFTNFFFFLFFLLVFKIQVAKYVPVCVFTYDIFFHENCFNFKVLKFIEPVFYGFRCLYPVKEMRPLKTAMKILSNYSLMFSFKRFSFSFYIILKFYFCIKYNMGICF